MILRLFRQIKPMRTNTEIGYDSKIEGDVIVTRVDAALNWFRKNSIWPMPMGSGVLRHRIDGRRRQPL